jgi:2-polyprenyl-3-methyl-5-hydroxy-6-metoxy-1,4-benzoquinol methylase
VDSIESRRLREIWKYGQAYKRPEYRMGEERMAQAKRVLSERKDLRKSLLDVGCGRGEVLKMASELEYGWVRGVDPIEVPDHDGFVYQGSVLEIPEWLGEFETVTCFDVMEHLLPEDSELAVKAMERVATRRMVLTISNLPDMFGPFMGLGHLHINLQPYEKWDVDLSRWLREWRVVWRKDLGTSINQMWEATR